jgi:hypothetical protein
LGNSHQFSFSSHPFSSFTVANHERCLSSFLLLPVAQNSHQLDEIPHPSYPHGHNGFAPNVMEIVYSYSGYFASHHCIPM